MMSSSSKRQRKRCKFDGCENGAVKGGVCRRHGAKTKRKKRCEFDGCENQAQKGGVCVKHGAELKRCKFDGCENIAVKGGVCIKHGAKTKRKKRCQIDGCENGAIQGGVCCRHGAKLKRCKFDGCENGAVRGSVCVKHGAKLKRCKFDGCENGAVKGGVCVKHGAKLKRCKFDGCENQAQKGGVCRRHGAKTKRCQIEGCENQAQKGGVCIKHGAKTKRCQIEGCEKIALKGGLCIAHGGGHRCSRADYHPLDAIPPHAGFKKDGQRYCHSCFAYLFPDLAKMQVRQEHLILAEIQRRLPELAEFFTVWDCAVPNSCTLKKPDLLYDMWTWYLQFEVDEWGNLHEDNRERLREINEAMGDRPGIVIRVNPNGTKPMLSKRQTTAGNYGYQATTHFESKMDQLESFVRKVVVPFLHADSPFAASDVPTVYKLFFEEISIAAV